VAADYLNPEKKGTIGEIALHMKEPAILITIVAAGAVLLVATLSVIVMAIIFWPYFAIVFESLF